MYKLAVWPWNLLPLTDAAAGPVMGNSRFDVVVVGGGPGGATAARLIAAAGGKVLLLEKARIGRDKPCGGGLTPRSYRHLDVPIDDLVNCRIRHADLRHRPTTTLLVDLGEDAVVMVRRREFDRRLVESAGAAGAEVHDLEPATAIEEGTDGNGAMTVRSRRASYDADVVLLATGAEAPLSGGVGLEGRRAKMAVALELEGEAMCSRLDGSSFVFDYAVPGGYAWAFPKGDWWNVGILSSQPRRGTELRGRLGTFMEQIGISFAEPDFVARRAPGRRIPMWTAPGELHRGRLALVGDAAGLADPLFGEGIAQALASGRLAAEGALEVIAGRAADMAPYSRKVQTALGKHLKRTRQTARLLYAMPAVSIRTLSILSFARRVATHVATEPF